MLPLLLLLLLLVVLWTLPLLSLQLAKYMLLRFCKACRVGESWGSVSKSSFSEERDVGCLTKGFSTGVAETVEAATGRGSTENSRSVVCLHELSSSSNGAEDDEVVEEFEKRELVEELLTVRMGVLSIAAYVLTTEQKYKKNVVKRGLTERFFEHERFCRKVTVWVEVAVK